MTVAGPQEVFDALGDPVRRFVLEFLAAGEQPAGGIVDAVRRRTPMSQPAVSQHLKVLRDAGLVTVRADGTRRFYTLDPEGLEAAQDWLARLTDPMRQFAQPLDALVTEVARGKRARHASAADSAREQRPDREQRLDRDARSA